MPLPSACCIASASAVRMVSRVVEFWAMRRDMERLLARIPSAHRNRDIGRALSAARRLSVLVSPIRWRGA